MVDRLPQAMGAYLKRASAARQPTCAVGMCCCHYVITWPLVVTDCGAGVGRVTQELLLRHFTIVDLVEPSAHLLQQAQANLAAASGTAFPREHALGTVHQCGLQHFDPQPLRYADYLVLLLIQPHAAHRYDCIWVQWACLYLTDGARVMSVMHAHTATQMTWCRSSSAAMGA